LRFRQDVAAFRAVSSINDRHVQMLRLQYHSRERTVTAKQLADLVGYGSYSVVNAAKKGVNGPSCSGDMGPTGKFQCGPKSSLPEHRYAAVEMA